MQGYLHYCNVHERPASEEVILFPVLLSFFVSAWEYENNYCITKCLIKKKNSMALSPLVNYTDRAIAAGQQS
jgi:hypothetical protein